MCAREIVCDARVMMTGPPSGGTPAPGLALEADVLRNVSRLSIGILIV